MDINRSNGERSQEMGIVGVHVLIERIRRADLGSLRTFSRDLVRRDVPGMLPIMERLLNDDNPDLALAAYDWLARTPDQQAFTILVARLEDSDLSENERGLAAEALGRRADVAAVEPIRRVAGRYVTTVRDSRAMRDRLLAANVNDAVARTLVRLAVAEAQLGGDELAAIPIVFALEDANIGRESIVRVEAVAALASVAEAGVLDALHRALFADDIEVAERAILPLQLIGAREAVDILVRAAASQRLELAEIALTAVVAVTGQGPGANRSVFDLAPDELRLWWQTVRPGFQSGMCYRRGKPLSIATLVELLQDPKNRSNVADELRIITGFDCDYDDGVAAVEQDSVVCAAEHWAATEGVEYRPGVLYKYGRERNLVDAVRTSLFGDG